MKAMVVRLDKKILMELFVLRRLCLFVTVFSRNVLTCMSDRDYLNDEESLLNLFMLVEGETVDSFGSEPGRHHFKSTYN